MPTKSKDGSVGTVISYRLDDGRIWVLFPAGARDIYFSLASGSVLGPIQPTEWVQRDSFSGGRVKVLGLVADHSLLPRSEVKNAWSYSSSLHHTSSRCGSQLETFRYPLYLHDMFHIPQSFGSMRCNVNVNTGITNFQLYLCSSVVIISSLQTSQLKFATICLSPLCVLHDANFNFLDFTTVTPFCKGWKLYNCFHPLVASLSATDIHFSILFTLITIFKQCR
jgi:hypothetical protein